MGRHWIVARIKPKCENWAVQNILRQGLDYYIPKFAVTVPPSKKHPKGEKKVQYLFPSYIFVHTDGRWRCLMGTFGLLGVILIGDSPAIMPDDAVTQLRAREDASGLIRLPSESKNTFKAGQSVRVIAGPFQGHVGIYEGSSSQDRERILLELLGRRTQVLIAGDYLAAA